jgi:hypothetical protein
MVAEARTDPLTDETEEELEAESMLKLMQQIQQMRELNVTATSDEERRKNAEQLILKLSKYMDIDEDEEDYGDD